MMTLLTATQIVVRWQQALWAAGVLAVFTPPLVAKPHPDSYCQLVHEQAGAGGQGWPELFMQLQQGSDSANGIDIRREQKGRLGMSVHLDQWWQRGGASAHATAACQRYQAEHTYVSTLSAVAKRAELAAHHAAYERLTAQLQGKLSDQASIERRLADKRATVADLLDIKQSIVETRLRQADMQGELAELNAAVAEFPAAPQKSLAQVRADLLAATERSNQLEHSLRYPSPWRLTLTAGLEQYRRLPPHDPAPLPKPLPFAVLELRYSLDRLAAQRGGEELGRAEKARAGSKPDDALALGDESLRAIQATHHQAATKLAIIRAHRQELQELLSPLAVATPLASEGRYRRIERDIAKLSTDEAYYGALHTSLSKELGDLAVVSVAPRLALPQPSAPPPPAASNEQTTAPASIPDSSSLLAAAAPSSATAPSSAPAPSSTATTSSASAALSSLAAASSSTAAPSPTAADLSAAQSSATAQSSSATLFPQKTPAAAPPGPAKTPAPAPAIAAKASPEQLYTVTMGSLLETPAVADYLQTSSAQLRLKRDGGDAKRIAVAFKYLGAPTNMASLGSGSWRQQFGVFLLAANQCNALYAMLRLHPGQASRLVVQEKANPGLSTHADCRNRGYRTLTPTTSRPLSDDVKLGDDFLLSAQVEGQTLRVSINGQIVWDGLLKSPGTPSPSSYAGVRTDNAYVAFKFVSL